MFGIIVAMTKDGGIGLNGGMAWKCREELQLFKKKTMGAILVMGRKTVENLPHLPGREIWCLTRDKNLDTSEYKNDVVVVTDLILLWNLAMHERKKGRKMFCAGGAQLFNLMKHPKWRVVIDEYHVSIMKEDHKCDTFWELPEFDPAWTILKKKNHTKFVEYVYAPCQPAKLTQEKEYLTLLHRVLDKGVTRHGRNGETKSLFAQNLHFDLTKGFPLLTTKRMFWRGIVEELLFFLKGETDSKILEEKGIKIWKGNTEREFLDSNGFENRREGMMGPMYGFQWRSFNGDYNESTGRVQTMFVNERPPNLGVDQLKDVINKIKYDPHSRRILMTDYNPAQASQGVLYPCHSLMLQFYVDGDYLDMYCFNRSSDLFLGLPFNIASSSLLLTIIAWTTGKIPRHFHLTLGDAHIYAEHIQAVQEQLSRISIVLPTLVINRELRGVQDIDRLAYGDFVLQNYSCHPPIKAKMIA